MEQIETRFEIPKHIRPFDLALVRHTKLFYDPNADNPIYYTVKKSSISSMWKRFKQQLFAFQRQAFNPDANSQCNFVYNIIADASSTDPNSCSLIPAELYSPDFQIIAKQCAVCGRIDKFIIKGMSCHVRPPETKQSHLQTLYFKYNQNDIEYYNHLQYHDRLYSKITLFSSFTGAENIRKDYYIQPVNDNEVDLFLAFEFSAYCTLCGSKLYYNICRLVVRVDKQDFQRVAESIGRSIHDHQIHDLHYTINNPENELMPIIDSDNYLTRVIVSDSTGTDLTSLWTSFIEINLSILPIHDYTLVFARNRDEWSSIFHETLEHANRTIDKLYRWSE